MKWYGGVSENNPGTIDLTTPGTSTRTVLAEMNGCQSAMVTVEAEVRETPSFASLVHLEDLTTEVTLNNSALEYTYVLDEGRTAPSLAVHDIRQSEGSFTGSGNLGMLTVGMHTLKVTDNAGCSCDTTFKVTGAPLVPDKFFTPNNDGVNDKWLIHGGIGRIQSRRFTSTTAMVSNSPPSQPKTSTDGMVSTTARICLRPTIGTSSR